MLVLCSVNRVSVSESQNTQILQEGNRSRSAQDHVYGVKKIVDDCQESESQMRDSTYL